MGIALHFVYILIKQTSNCCIKPPVITAFICCKPDQHFVGCAVEYLAQTIFIFLLSYYFCSQFFKQILSIDVITIININQISTVFNLKLNVKSIHICTVYTHGHTSKFQGGGLKKVKSHLSALKI